MQRTGTNQTIVMSGESGAGKTETTKYTMLFLTRRAARTNSLESLTEAIIESNTVTEAFGNAKTVRNNNSSRFGKYLHVYFSSSGAVVAGGIKTYLLERPRVTQVAKGERSYHVFYQLLAGASDANRAAWSLYKLDAQSFRVLRGSGCTVIEGVSDATKFKELYAGLLKVGVSVAACEGLFSTMAGIMVSPRALGLHTHRLGALHTPYE